MADELKLVEKSRIMDSPRISGLSRGLRQRSSRKIKGQQNLYRGIRRRGVPLAERIVDKIGEPKANPRYWNHRHHFVSRRPFDRRCHPIVNRTELDTDIDGKVIVLVDDVLYTGERSERLSIN